jgi:1,2-diacylglycerol 3-beta-galactosyltransferase
MEQLKNILILTADVGYGHRSTANAIASALHEIHGNECVIKTINLLDDERTPGILRDSQTDYDRLVRELPDLYKLSYQLSDSTVPTAITERALTVLMYNVISQIFKEHQPDVVVCTTPLYPAPVNAVIALRRLHLPNVNVITDVIAIHRLWFSKWSDLILVPTWEVYKQAIEADIPEERIRITGIPISPAFGNETRTKEAIRKELGWNPEMTTILVVGSKRVKNLEKVLHVLNHSGLPLQLVIVAGGDDTLYDQLRRTEWHQVTHIYNFVQNMPDLMHGSDCILSKAGGLIVTEALACGLPLLFVDVTPGQEEGNASFVVQNHAGARAENPILALEILCHWLANDRQILKEYQENARSLGRPRSAYSAAELIWSAAYGGFARSPRERASLRPKLRELLNNFGIKV